jgi:hypothetical protein
VGGHSANRTIELLLQEQIDYEYEVLHFLLLTSKEKVLEPVLIIPINETSTE